MIERNGGIRGGGGGARGAGGDRHATVVPETLDSSTSSVVIIGSSQPDCDREGRL